MDLFSSESKMQEWLSDALGNSCGLSDLITNLDYVKTFSPSSLADRKIIASYETCTKSLGINEVISKNENISVNSGDVLKPDFILYAPETQSIVIVELKNLRGPTRQAGTELAAYSCEVKSAVPFISDGDIVNVIISTEWPTLLRHYIFHQIFWQGKNVICLEPHQESSEIKLKLLEVAKLEQNDIPIKISDRYLGGCQISLEDYASDNTQQDKYLEQMKAALHAISVWGYGQNGHGFAFLWKDDWKCSVATYSITVIHFAPFQSIERFLHLENAEPTGFVKSLMELACEHNPNGAGNALNELIDCCRVFLVDICRPTPEGFTSWNNLRKVMTNQTELIAFEAWGMFGEVFTEKLAREYQNGNHNCLRTSPDLGLTAIDELIDNDYTFIDLVNYFYDGEHEME